MSGDRENKWKSCFCSLFLPFLCESGPALFPLKLSLKSTVTWWSLYLTDPSFSSRFRNAALTAVIFKTSSSLKVHSSPIFVFSLGSILLYILHYSHWAEMASVPLLAFFAGISFLYFCFFFTLATNMMVSLRFDWLQLLLCALFYCLHLFKTDLDKL